MYESFLNKLMLAHLNDVRYSIIISANAAMYSEVMMIVCVAFYSSKLAG